MKKRAKFMHKFWPYVLIGLVLVIALYVSWVYFVVKPTISPSFTDKNVSAITPLIV